jgi:hypothetical protein
MYLNTTKLIFSVTLLMGSSIKSDLFDLQDHIYILFFVTSYGLTVLLNFSFFFKTSSQAVSFVTLSSEININTHAITSLNTFLFSLHNMNIIAKVIISDLCVCV